MSNTKDVVIERRSSLNLNMTHLPHPIAESTCLNGTSKSPNHFPWGGSPISPKNRSNSSLCLISTNGTTHAVSKNRAVSPTRLRENAKRIDPRVYADCQSRGLASRIVKYHENGSSLNRSMSMNNLYSKPGHFPVVHLKKTELPYRATKQNLSMTRIAPPEKSIFIGNTLSSLMRSNSIVGFHKSDEEISRENRPIMHPPPTESDLAPTRSVLDVLKEISRKRINSEDPSTVDPTKKYCNRDADTVDLPAIHVPLMTNSMPIGPNQSFKRQRDQVCQAPVAHQASQSKQSLHQSTQNSPEQVAKKRLCSYNNDITSSLSSSRHQANKRKLFEGHKSQGLSPTNLATSRRTASAIGGNSSSPSYDAQRSKMQRQQSDVNGVTQSAVSLPRSNQSYAPTRTITESVVPASAKRTVSEPTLQSGQTKPKLTLFNKDYDEKCDTITTAVDDRDEDNDLEDGDYAGIQFVKPKKSSAVSGLKNPLIERAQKSKLALMLRGLRGELFGENEDETDSSQTNTAAERSAADGAPKSGDVVPVVAATTSASLSTQTITTTAITTTRTTAAVSGGALLNSSSAPPTTSSASVPGLVQAPAQPQAMAITTAAAATTTTTVTISAATTVGAGVFQLSPSVTTTSPLAQPAATTPPNKTISPLVGLKLTPQSTASTLPTFSNAPPTTSSSGNIPALPMLSGFPTTGGFSFGTPATSVPASAPLSLTTASTALPASTSLATSTTTPAGSTTTAVPAPQPAVTFTFGTTVPQAKASGGFSALSAAPTFGVTTPPVFGATSSAATGTGFGGPATTKSFVFGTPSSVPSFGGGGFGGSGTATSAGVAITTPSFGFGAPAGPQQQQQQQQPQQHQQQKQNQQEQQPQQQQAQPAASPFGAAAVQPNSGPAAPSASPFAFGSNTNKAEAPKFVFGAPIQSSVTHAPATTAASLFSTNTASNSSGAPGVTPSTSNLFGGSSSTTLTGVVKPSFSFGSANSSPIGSATTLFGSASATTLPTGAATTATSGSTSTFGSLSNTDSKTFAFGSSGSGPSPASSTNNLFAGSSSSGSSSSGFSFGSAASVPSTTHTVKPLAQSSSGFSFGGGPGPASGVPANQVPAGTFSFGSATNSAATNAFTFGSTSSSAGGATTNKPFTFGSNTVTSSSSTGATATNTVAPFSFTANTATTTTAAPNTKLFTFGSTGVATDKPVANVFGTAVNQATPQATAKPTTFNFTGNNGGAAPIPSFGTPTQAHAAANGPSNASTTNIFAPTASQTSPFMSANGERVIRRATRRLHKS